MTTENRVITDNIISTFDNGNKILLLGCGGSLAESSHFAAELIGIGKPAIALNDPVVITALSNDFSFDECFSRQIKALAKMDDMVIAFSTSGLSKSVVKALEYADKLGLDIIDWPRDKGTTTGEIQENQLKDVHEVYLAIKKHYENNI